MEAGGATERIAELERELLSLRAGAAAEMLAALPETLGVLIVRVGHTRLALPLAGVHEVLPRVMLFRLPSAPDWHAGSLAWRGQHVPVVDLGARWDGEVLPVRLEDRIVLVQHDGGLHGLLVAEVVDVDTFVRSELTPSTHAAAVALTTRGGGTVALLAPGRLFGFTGA